VDNEEARGEEAVADVTGAPQVISKREVEVLDMVLQ